MTSHLISYLPRTRLRLILSLLALVGALLIGGNAFTAITNASPASMQVMLFKTELHNGSAWVTVLDNGAGATVDLVTNPGTAFGTGTIAVGTYNKIRFTLGNTVQYSGTSAPCPPAVNAPFLIDNAAARSARPRVLDRVSQGEADL